MEQTLPGYDYKDPECDPIGVSNDLRDSGDTRGAYRIRMDLCQADIRCLDAHAHLGYLAFGRMPCDALLAVRHYEVGFRIGELSLAWPPADFDGVLAWGHIDNRPFLRCMHGYGLCLWRLGRFEEALQIFDRMLWLNPTDNQGIRFLTGDIRAKRSWDCRRDK
jgi:tetratricopeptide (TPR) repeat protein